MQSTNKHRMIVRIYPFHKHRTWGECKTWDSHSSDHKDFCLLEHKSCSMVNKYQCLWTPAAWIFGGDVVKPPKEQVLNVVALFL